MGDEEDLSNYYEGLESDNKQLRNKNLDLAGHISSQGSFAGTGAEANMAQYRLQTDDILDKVEHFLKGDIIKEEDGEVKYCAQEDEELVILNVYGVNSIMQIMGIYINRNHILSFYDEERIYEILGDLGDELSIFIFCNYEKMGMDSNYKKSRYKLLVLNILHIIESTYRRALHGEESKNMNTHTMVTQAQNIGGMGASPGMQMQKKRFNLFNYKTW